VKVVDGAFVRVRVVSGHGRRAYARPVATGNP